MEEAADGKLAVVAWTIGRWRWMVAWEGGWSSGGASRRGGGVEVTHPH
jgi:hypothetical protein